MLIVHEPLGINENIMSLKEKTLNFPSDDNELFKDKKMLSSVKGTS
jgi:hypothetical protein